MFRTRFSILCLILTFGFITQSISKSNVDTTLTVTVSDDTELFVKVKGNGIPCLYVHGGPGVGSYWMEKIYGDVLEQYFTMVYLDQRGSGRSSSAPGGNYSPERMAKDFEEVRKVLGIESWVTFSHSFGGLLQMEHAKRYPDTIKGMMLIESTLNLDESIRSMIQYSFDFLNMEGDEQEPYLDESKSPLDRLIPLFNKMREKGMFWKFHYSDPQNYDRMDSVMAEVSHPNKEFNRLALSLEAYHQNYKPLASKLHMPVLLYYGTKDYSVGINHAEDIPFPKKTVHKWDGGHVPFMEGQSELEKAIQDWLTKIN